MTATFCYNNKYAAAAAAILIVLGMAVIIFAADTVSVYDNQLIGYIIFFIGLFCCILTVLIGTADIENNSLILHYAYSKKEILLSDIKECVCSSDYQHTRFGGYYRILMDITTIDGKHFKIWDKLTVKADELIKDPHALEREIADHPFTAMCGYIDHYIR